VAQLATFAEPQPRPCGQVKAEEMAGVDLAVSFGDRRRLVGRPRDRICVVPERGRAAPAVAEAGGGVAQVEAVGQELAGDLMPSAP
jgi:hypothetical protein